MKGHSSEVLREKVRDIVEETLRHVRIQINELWLVNTIRIIVEGTIGEMMVGYAERLGVLERNASQVEGLMREVGAAIELNVGSVMEGGVNTHRAVREMMDEAVKTAQGIIETSEKKMMDVLEAKIAEALASIKAQPGASLKRENDDLDDDEEEEEENPSGNARSCHFHD